MLCRKLTLNPQWQAEFIDDGSLDYLPPSRFDSIPPYVSKDPPDVAFTKKFAQDLVAVAKGDVTYLAGTVLLPSTGVWKGEEGAKLSQAFVDAIMGPDRSSILAASNSRALLFDRLHGDISNAFSVAILGGVRARCRKGMNIENSQVDARIARMKSAYFQEGTTSVDLAEEMRKQSGFVVKMDALGWLAPGRFGGDGGRLFPLQKAAIRYRMSFLLLRPGSFLLLIVLYQDAFLHCISQMQEDMACPSTSRSEQRSGRLGTLTPLSIPSTGYRALLATAPTEIRFLRVSSLLLTPLPLVLH